MSQIEIEGVLARFRAMFASWGEAPSLNAMREGLDRFFLEYPPLEGTSVTSVDAGVACLRVQAPGADPRKAVLSIHGGGFSTGSAQAHVPFASRISEAAGAGVMAVDYRRAPEHRYPAALDDCLAAYRWLISSEAQPRDIALCGDSAGGGLALAMLLRLREAGDALPSCAILLSPWVDLACTGASYVDNAARDPIASREMALGMAQAYLGDADPAAPFASPVYGDLRGLPPLLVHAGDTECFLDDARTIAARVAACGGSAKLAVWPGMIHQWHLHAGALQEADAAIGELGVFLRLHMGN